MSQTTRNGTDLIRQLTDLFRDTGDAHHRAFISTNGDDTEWPLWYAVNMLDRVNAYFNSKLTVMELADLLLRAETDRNASGAAQWPAFYAEWLVQRFK